MTHPFPARTPVSTYRLQLNGQFSFFDAARLVPYMSQLGITDCYCSPILTARRGSTHGYDVCDHSTISSEIGGERGFEVFARALRLHGLGLTLDIVPNHMSTDPRQNSWWRNMLENGPSSPFGRFFDIDWVPVKNALQQKVLLPVLGDQYGTTLERGDLQVRFEDGDFSLRYFDLDLPLNPRELRRVLRHNLEALAADAWSGDADVIELESILFQLDHLPVYTDTRDAMVVSRHREKEVARHRLKALLQESPRMREHVERNVREFNGVPGNPRSFDLLHDMLEGQVYRLSYWRTAMHEINYRRFFDINELAGLRVEDPEVFAASHDLIRDLVRRGDVHGLRLDHIDGLFDPKAYLVRLAAATSGTPIYIVAEKIVSDGEPLRPDWPLHGTTGYDFMNDVNGLFVDGRHAREFHRLYGRFTGRTEAFEDIVYQSKKLVIASSMASELNVLAHQLNRISDDDRRFRDFTLDSLQEALREVAACFPVYRTYFSSEGWEAFDEQSVDAAVAGALARNPAMEPSIFSFIRQMLLPAVGPDGVDEDYRRRAGFARKFQQYTSPVQAKGLEDTAFYRFVPLLSLNEVGGHPARFGCSPTEFHQRNAHRLQHWPLTMLATATHDSKRGEDARTRISVLSEMPHRWRAVVSRWARVNASLKTEVKGVPAPDRADEYLFYQALLGAWPAGATELPDEAFVERMCDYLRKAVKEAKLHTSWINPAEAYDAAVTRFVRMALAGPNARAFFRLLLPFAHRVAQLGAINSLSQVLVKIGSPGVPDFYRGTELWDLSLVDPDNRGTVDFEQRAAWLDQIGPGAEGSLDARARWSQIGDRLARWEDGRIKLYVTATALHLRQRWREVFLEGSYIPLVAEGRAADHIVGFARCRGDRSVVVLAPRLVAGLYGSVRTLTAGGEAWGDTRVRIPDDLRGVRYRNALTGEEVVGSRSDGGTWLTVGESLREVPATMLYSATQETAQ